MLTILVLSASLFSNVHLSGMFVACTFMFVCMYVCAIFK